MSSKSKEKKDKDKDKDKKEPKEKEKKSKEKEKEKKSKNKKESDNYIKKNKESNNDSLMNAISEDEIGEEVKEKKEDSKQFYERPTNREIISNSLEKCDGCYEGVGHCFCINCEKIFCRACEDQIHMIPANRMHERVPVSDVYHLKKLCYHHSNSLKFYCESCEEPICNECHLIGPHNNKLHRITNVFESFRKKFFYINNMVQKSLIGKLDDLTSHIQEIEFCIDDVKLVKNEIEREIRAEFSQMIENLRSEEGKKLAILQYESSILQKDINKIQDIVNVVHEVNLADSPDMIGFLLRFKQLNESIELSLAKPFKKLIDVSVEDFPRELDLRKQKMEKYEKMKKLLKVKDDIIWNLLQEKKAKEEREMIKLKEKTYNEISEWAKLSDKYAMELKRYDLVCHFCGCYLDDNTVNSTCNRNISDINKSIEKGGFSLSSVPVDALDTKRHFFGKPDRTKENHHAQLATRPDNMKIKTNSEQIKLGNKTEKANKNPFENNIFNDTKLSTYKSKSTSPPGNTRYSSDESRGEKLKESWVGKVARKIDRNNINFYQILSDYDLDCDGYITPEDIRLALVKLQIDLSEDDYQNMLKYFDIAKMERVSIKEFSKNFMNQNKTI